VILPDSPLVSFVVGKKPPFDVGSGHCLALVPHQELATMRLSFREISAFTHLTAAQCPADRTTGARHLPAIARIVTEHGSTTLWMDSKDVPSICLASALTSWCDETSSLPSASLIVVIREDPGLAHKSRTRPIPWWTNVRRSLAKNELDKKSLVWYPSLSRAPADLEDCVARLNPVDIFPLVEFPDRQGIRSDDFLLAHSAWLQRRRVRTERVIYLPYDKPEMAYSILAQSMAALPRSSSSPRQAAVTPGPPTFLYFAEVLAGVSARSVVMVPREETAFSGGPIAGYCVLSRRP